ncbi:MAG: enoyl-CoA hydratase-related protein [bacterium]
MAEPLVRVDRKGETATLALSRPEKRNALNTPMMEAAREALSRLAGEEGLRVLVLTGAGEKAFCGGADVGEMAALRPGAARAFIERLHGLIRAVREFPHPVVARCQGAALGGGLELLLGCDLRIAAEDALLGMPEVRLGVPSVIEAALLVPLAGLSAAQDLLLTGRTIDGAEAARLGIVHRAVPAEALDGAVEEAVADLLRAAPGALRAQKVPLARWLSAYLDAAIPPSIDAFDAAYRDGEPNARMSAFLEERKSRRRG